MKKERVLYLVIISKPQQNKHAVILLILILIVTFLCNINKSNIKLMFSNLSLRLLHKAFRYFIFGWY